MKKHLIIPDPHAHPNYSNERFEWLGKYILDTRPDVIINIGDHYDMPSLCSYDKGKKSFEGRRYTEDIASGQDAFSLLDAPSASYNLRRRRSKHSVYNPSKYYLLGNHENRISRAIELSPEYEGALSLLHLQCPGWTTVSFLSPLVIDEICYSHYFISGVKGNSVGGEHPASSLLRRNFMSSVCGHSHIRDLAERTRADGRKIIGLVAGCFIDYEMDYAGEANKLWWRGVIMLHNVQDGTFEPEFISINQLREMYG